MSVGVWGAGVQCDVSYDPVRELAMPMTIMSTSWVIVHCTIARVAPGKEVLTRMNANGMMAPARLSGGNCPLSSQPPFACIPGYLC